MEFNLYRNMQEFGTAMTSVGNRPLRLALGVVTLATIAVPWVAARGAESALAAPGCGPAQQLGPFTPDRGNVVTVNAGGGVAHVALWDPDKRSQYADRQVSIVTNRGDVLQLANRVSGQAWVNTPGCSLEDVLNQVIQHDNATSSRLITEDEAAAAGLVQIVSKTNAGDANGHRVNREYIQQGQTPGLMDVPANQAVEVIEIIDPSGRLTYAREGSFGFIPPAAPAPVFVPPTVSVNVAPSPATSTCLAQDVTTLNPDSSSGQQISAPDAPVQIAEWDRNKRTDLGDRIASFILPQGGVVQLPDNVGGKVYKFPGCLTDDAVINAAKYDQNNNGIFVSLDAQRARGLISVISAGGADQQGHHIGGVFFQPGQTPGLGDVPGNQKVNIVRIDDGAGNPVNWIRDITTNI